MTTAAIPQVDVKHYKEVVQLLVRNSLMSRAALYKTLLDPEGRNLNYDCGYPDSISITEYKQMWDREGDARRVVRCEPEACWVADPYVYETEDPKETAFEKAWAILLKKFNLYNHLFHLDEISGIGQYGILLFGLDDGEDLSQPVPGVNEIGEGDGTEHNLIYLREFDESCVQVSTRESKTTSPRYSLPLSYKINFMDTADSGVQATDVVSKSVHWTRVLHVADNQLVSQVYGTPRMKPVFNRLLDIRKILGGSAEMFWKGAFPGISFEMNPDLADQGIQIDTAQIREEVKAYMDGLQRFLAIQGMQAKQLSPTVADPSGHVDTHRKAIAIALSVPFRVLFGSEQAQLASGQDAKTWNARVGGRQNKYVTPVIIRPFVDRLIALGCLPVPESGEYLVNWPDLDTPSESDKAGVAVQKTSAITTYIAGGGDQLLPPATFLTQVMGMEQDQVDAIMKEVFEQQEETEEGAVMPSFGEEGTSPEEVAMPSAFNGAQVTAATQIVKDVAAGELPRESGLGQLEVFFRLTPEQANQVMGTAGTKTKVEPNPGIKDDEVQTLPKKSGQKPPFPVGNYDPNQARDEDGKWTDEGGGESSKDGGGDSETTIKEIESFYGFKEDSPVGASQVALAKMFLGKTPGLSKDEVIDRVKGVIEYVRDSGKVNTSLRSGQAKSEQVLLAVKGMASLPQVKAGTVVYRGFARTEENIKVLLKVGSVVSDDGILSTSKSKDIAFAFAKKVALGKERTPVLLKLISSRATGRMVPREATSMYGLDDEKEVVFPPSSRVKITHVNKVRIGKRIGYEITGEIL